MAEPLDRRIQLVISKGQVREIDEWRLQPDLPSRSEAIRRFIEAGLKSLANNRSGSGEAPCQCIVSGGMLTTSPGFSTCGFSPWKQMRPIPERQNSVCPTGWACQAVRAPGVNVITDR
jgi:hypothetical protein